LDSIVEKADEEAPALDHLFYSKLAERLGERLLECEDRIPVVTGFFGVVPGSLLTQIGRGYTDFCAALCAVGLQASELQIWKEVDGIFTADPRKVPTARVLPYVTPEEASELTYYGSEVIHPFTMEQVINANIPIRIKNVENPQGQGTVIFPDDQSSVDHAATSESALAVQEAKRKTSARLPTAVTIKDNILVLNIRSNKKTISHGFFAKIFTILDKHGIIVDLISTSEVQLSLSMHGVFKKGLLDKVVADLETVGEVSFKRDMAILSLVGKQMKNMVGIAGRMFR
jgi:aspartate kinase